jgi:hypothetical protein
MYDEHMKYGESDSGLCEEGSGRSGHCSISRILTTVPDFHGMHAFYTYAVNNDDTEELCRQVKSIS